MRKASKVKNNAKHHINDPNVKKATTKFIYQPLTGGKHTVFLAGDFNGWSSTETPMEEIDGIYEVVLSLDEGKYGYKFVVDGNWIVDENAVEFIDDGYGGKNSIIYVGNKNEIDALRKVSFTYQPKNIVIEVYLVGSMNDWNTDATPMKKEDDGVWRIFIKLDYIIIILGQGVYYIPTSMSRDEIGFGRR